MSSPVSTVADLGGPVFGVSDFGKAGSVQGVPSRLRASSLAASPRRDAHSGGAVGARMHLQVHSLIGGHRRRALVGVRYLATATKEVGQ